MGCFSTSFLVSFGPYKHTKAAPRVEVRPLIIFLCYDYDSYKDRLAQSSDVAAQACL